MDAPPVLPESLPPFLAEAVPPPGPIATWRRAVMLSILLTYIVSFAIVGAQQGQKDGPILPATKGLLLLTFVQEMGLFVLVFGIAWAFGRPSKEELFLKRWDGWMTLVWSVVWSVGVRLLAIPAMLAFAGGTFLYRSLSHPGEGLDLQKLRPSVERLLPMEAFQDPWYVVLAATVLSFGLGGIREELWRAGVLSSFRSLLPPEWKNWKGWAAGIVLASLVFGGAHITQGMAGVVMTAAVGLGLGVVMVWRRSYWEASLAHGFFNATTMGALWFIQRFHPEMLQSLIPK